MKGPEILLLSRPLIQMGIGNTHPRATHVLHKHACVWPSEEMGSVERESGCTGRNWRDFSEMTAICRQADLAPCITPRRDPGSF